ncbi:MAG: type II toxin-antitoxin system VapC family toxin [Candidatus Bathyarchaeia archaeon]
MIISDMGILIETVRERGYETGAITIITLIEFLKGIAGPEKRAKAKELLEQSFTILNLENEDIKVYCDLYCKLKEEGALIPEADLLIAAITLSHNMTLKTRDKHFEKLR